MDHPVKIDSRKIRTLREARAWSQEQLAQAAGLSVRTVQRAENEGTASRESKVCLAAALGVDHADLAPAQAGAPSLSNGAAMASVSAIAFGSSGLLMLASLLLIGGDMASPVFSIGSALSIAGMALGCVAVVIARRQQTATALPEDKLRVSQPQVGATSLSSDARMAGASAMALGGSGLLMLALLLLTGEGMSSPMFWVGFALAVAGSAFGTVAAVLTRRQSRGETGE